MTGASALGSAGNGVNGTHLWAGTADLADVAVMDLRRFWGLFRAKSFVLKGGFLGESVSCPGRRRRHSCHSLFLLLLLLLVVAGSSRVNRCFIA